jgi:hypothetical protein
MLYRSVYLHCTQHTVKGILKIGETNLVGKFGIEQAKQFCYISNLANVAFIAFVVLTNRSKVNPDYIPKLSFCPQEILRAYGCLWYCCSTFSNNHVPVFFPFFYILYNKCVLE